MGQDGARRWSGRAASGLMAAWLAGAAAAHAQDPYLDMFNTQNQSAVDMAGTAAINSAIGDAAREARASPAHTTAFTPVPAVSARVERAFLHALSARLPTAAATFEREFASGALRQRYRAVLDRLGLSEHDLADMTAAYYLGLWELVHGQTLARAQAQAAVAQMRAGVRSDAALMALADAQKQEVAEAYALYLAVALRSHERLARRDPARLAKLRQVIQDGRGIPLERMQVTARGFSAR